MVEKIFLFGLILFALFSIFTIKLRRAVIYMSVFSLLMSFVALIYHAPDVAIAEAVIGCTLSTMLYLIALKKKRVCSICFIQEEKRFEDHHIEEGKKKIVKILEKFLLEEGIEPQVVYSSINKKEILEHKNHNLILSYEEGKLYIYGAIEDDIFIRTANFLENKKAKNNLRDIEIVPYQMEGATCSLEV